jgi:hypothetical protein
MQIVIDLGCYAIRQKGYPGKISICTSAAGQMPIKKHFAFLMCAFAERNIKDLNKGRLT